MFASGKTNETFNYASKAQQKEFNNINHKKVNCTNSC